MSAGAALHIATLVLWAAVALYFCRLAWRTRKMVERLEREIAEQFPEAPDDTP